MFSVCYYWLFQGLLNWIRREYCSNKYCVQTQFLFYQIQIHLLTEVKPQFCILVLPIDESHSTLTLRLAKHLCTHFLIQSCHWRLHISCFIFLFCVLFIALTILLFKSNPKSQCKHFTWSNKTLNYHIIYWHKAQSGQSKMMVWTKCMCCPWAVQAEYSGHS